MRTDQVPETSCSLFYTILTIDKFLKTSG